MLIFIKKVTRRGLEQDQFIVKSYYIYKLVIVEYNDTYSNITLLLLIMQLWSAVHLVVHQCVVPLKVERRSCEISRNLAIIM